MTRFPAHRDAWGAASPDGGRANPEPPCGRRGDWFTLKPMAPSPGPLPVLPLSESSEELRLRTWVQLLRTVQLVERRIGHVLARHEMTLAQFDVLATLRFSHGLTQQELAERLLVTKGNVCGLVNRLEVLGWVERRPDSEDARANRLHLTDAGWQKIKGVLPEHHAAVFSALAGVCDPDVRAFRETLRRVESSFGLSI